MNGAENVYEPGVCRLCVIKSALGSAAGAAAGAIGNSIFSDLASWWASAYKAILDAFSSSFLHAGEVSLGDYLHSPLVAVEVGVGMVLAAAGVIWLERAPGGLGRVSRWPGP